MKHTPAICPRCQTPGRVYHTEAVSGLPWRRRYYTCEACDQGFSTVEMPYTQRLKVIVLRASRRRREQPST